MKYIHLIYDSKFSQGFYPWDSVNIDILIQELFERGVDAKITTLNQIAEEGLSSYKGDTIIFGGSQKKEERAVVDDYAFWLEKHGCNVVPSYDCLRALENKGFQVLASEYILNDNRLRFYYNTSDKIKFSKDFVYKLVDGAGSNGVFKCNELKSLTSRVNRVLLSEVSAKIIIPFIKQKIKSLIKWRYIKSKEVYYKPNLKLVMQEFIDGLDCDYKVLVFGHRFFVLKRNIANGDFRASGSNLFEVIENPPEQVLSFAHEVFLKLQSPYCSLDISIDSEGKTNLIEYQCTHFGPYTYMSATKVHILEQGNWISHQWQKRTLEWIYAESIVEYLDGYKA